jgi:hypothetical protein
MQGVHLWGGVLTLGTHGDGQEPHHQGRSSPQDEALRHTTLLGVRRKAPQRYPGDHVESVRICRICDFMYRLSLTRLDSDLIGM